MGPVVSRVRSGSSFDSIQTPAPHQYLINLPQHQFKDCRKNSQNLQSYYVSGSSEHPLLLRFGHPLRAPEIIHYTGHASCYNYEKKIPCWVLELLVRENSKANNSYKSYAKTSKLDPNHPPIYLAFDDDYKRSGWSRGHMAAVANHKFNPEALNDVNYLTNMVPQDQDNNSNFWNRLETYSRNLLNRCDKVWVVSGPLFMATKEGNQMVVKYQVIGESQVAVPTHLFKVLLAQKNDEYFLAAFLVPNKPIPKDRELFEFEVSLEYLEKKSGLLMFPHLNRKSVGELYEEDGR